LLHGRLGLADNEREPRRIVLMRVLHAVTETTLIKQVRPIWRCHHRLALMINTSTFAKAILERCTRNMNQDKISARLNSLV
jgi:hypothetical protein